jgi:dTDP-4-amino-4,6-dideoxygalactose transaminase
MNASGRYIGDEEKKLLMEVIDHGCLNRVGGRMVLRFEREFAALHGMRHGVASTSGSAALHVCVGALDLEPGDEVITSPVTDPGTIIGVLLANAVPIFADVDPKTGNILASSIEAQITDRTRAIIAVHLAGRPAQMDEIMAVARCHNLVVIEDCAQSHLAEYHGRLVGTMGDMSFYSFQQSKQMTTGDGGIMMTNDDRLAERARLFSDKAWPRERSPRDHLFLAPNYRMTDLQGAVGVAQTHKLQAIVDARRASAELMMSALGGVEGVRLAQLSPDEKSSWYFFPFWIDRDHLDVTPAVFQSALAAEGIPSQVGFMVRSLLDYTFMKERATYGRSQCPWSCPHTRPGIAYREEDYPGARAAVSEPIALHWNEGIGPSDVEDAAEAVRKIAMTFRR